MTWGFKNCFSKKQKIALLAPNSLCLEYKYILMKTFIWKFPFCHPLHKPTLGKTKKEARKEAWFDFFQQHTYEKKPTSLLPTFIPFLHVFTH